MTSNGNKERFIDGENDWEAHQYSIAINTKQLTKEIYIHGHTAPKKYYDFVNWATSLNWKR